MDKTRSFSPLSSLPAQDVWLDRLSYRRLLSVAGSLLIAVKGPDAELRKVLNTARAIRRNERHSEQGKAARQALSVTVKQYLERHRGIDTDQILDVPRPHVQGLPAFTQDGTLPAGFFHVTVSEFVEALAFNKHRQAQVKLLFEALTMLKAAGCTKVTIGGSFASSKPKPGDIDLVWHTEGMDEGKLDPIFSDATGLQRQRRLGIDSFSSQENWKLKLCLVQSLWGAGSPEPHECAGEEFDRLPRFRAVGVLVLDITGDLPHLKF
ncbi:MAG: hypothetical protein IT342_02655 [Candidatus Melainabacteria bacterium]|nr:hypothetical protein [Candidatus Melainabacteria bacterium]